MIAVLIGWLLQIALMIYLALELLLPSFSDDYEYFWIWKKLFFKKKSSTDTKEEKEDGAKK